MKSIYLITYTQKSTHIEGHPMIIKNILRMILPIPNLHLKTTEANILHC